MHGLILGLSHIDPTDNLETQVATDSQINGTACRGLLKGSIVRLVQRPIRSASFANHRHRATQKN